MVWTWPGHGFGDGREAQAIFVAEGEIGEQIGDGDDAAFFEDGGALGADVLQEFDGVGKLNGHFVRETVSSYISPEDDNGSARRVCAGRRKELRCADGPEIFRTDGA